MNELLSLSPGSEPLSTPIVPSGHRCPYCGDPAVLVSGADLFPQNEDVGNASFWRCSPCEAHVGCHPGTQTPMGTLAKRELRQARAALHFQIDPMWQEAPDLDCYAKVLLQRPWTRPDIVRRARERIYAYMAEQLGIEQRHCHIGMFDLETCERASQLMSFMDYESIRLEGERKKNHAKLVEKLKARGIDAT